MVLKDQVATNDVILPVSFQGLVSEWKLPGNPGQYHHYPSSGPHETTR